MCGSLIAISIISFPGTIFHVGINHISLVRIEVTTGCGLTSSANCTKQYSMYHMKKRYVDFEMLR